MFTFFFSLCFFYAWNQVTEGLIHLFTCVVWMLFIPASVSRCFSWGALLGLLRPFQPPRRRRWITAGDESAGHQSYRRAQFTVSYIAAVVSPSASILHNVREGWKLSILLFSVNQSVTVMADKCFSCCCLMLLFYKGGKCQSFPFFHLRSQPCFYLFILFNLLYPKPKCLVNQPRYSLLLHSFLKICSLLAFLLYTLVIVPAGKCVHTKRKEF